MHIRADLMIDFAGSREALRERLLIWAQRGRFRVVEEQPDRWLFRRGGFWRNLFVLFDTYGLLCEVSVLHLPGKEEVIASLDCSSAFHIATAGDREKLVAELHLLEKLCRDSGSNLDRLVKDWAQQDAKRPRQGEGIEKGERGDIASS